ncbi:MAG: hypothetical protein ACK56I_12085, partial [bacterium]
LHPWVCRSGHALWRRLRGQPRWWLCSRSGYRRGIHARFLPRGERPHSHGARNRFYRHRHGRRRRGRALCLRRTSAGGVVAIGRGRSPAAQ